MAEGVPPEASDVTESDIVFDCPHCGKSLAIDYRGAGLAISCSDCGKPVQVPIPEGLELADVDSTAEEQEAVIMNLRRSLAAAEARVRELETTVDELNGRRELLERSKADTLHRFGLINEKATAIRHAADDIAKAIAAGNAASAKY
jgi:transcription elongation factor Elf1